MAGTPWSLPSDPTSSGSAPDASYLLDDSHSFDSLAQLGLKAIQSGQVPVAAAHANAKKLGVVPKNSTPPKGPPPGAPSAAPDPGLSMAAQPASGMAPSPLSMSQGQPTPPGAPIDPDVLNQASTQMAALGRTGIRGDKETSNQSQNQDQGRRLVTQSRFLMDPNQNRLADLQGMGYTPVISAYQRLIGPNGEDLGEDRTKPIYDVAADPGKPDPNSPYQLELSGIKDLQANNAARALANSKKSFMDLSPLMALADSVKDTPGFRTNLSESYKAPVSDSTGIANQQDEIQKRLGDLQKALYENRKNMTGGTQLSGLSLMDQLKTAVGASTGTPLNDRAQLDQDNHAFRAHQAVLQKVVKDPVMNAMTTQYMNLNNAISNLANGPATPQAFAEAQQAIRANLGIKAGSGVDERNSTMLQNAGYNIDNLVQLATGKPTSIDQNDPDLRHIENLAANEKVNVRDFYGKRLALVAGGNDWVYKDPRYAMYAESLDPFLAAAKGQITPSSQVVKAQAQGGLPSEQTIRKAKAPLPTTGPNAAAPVRTKSLDQMSPAELDAYEAKLKGM